uniref:Immunoglobulin kappa light chain-like n=1 Tax=Xiphophorus maculatus TaxID=8083 RepID=A0A3B5PYW9_XIPMA
MHCTKLSYVYHVGVFFFLFPTAQTKTPKVLSVRQDKHFVFAKAGDSLTLQCFYENIVDARFYWYRQNLGQNPRLVSSYYKYETNATFHNEFRNNPRFELETTKGKNHLKIRDLKISDSAVYFCASSYLYMLDFAEGTMVYVEQTGSVTLNCTVQTGTCGGEHSVYCASHLNWYKQVPGESLQIISTFYKHHAGSDTFHKQFKDNRRFSVHTEEGLYDLKISDVRDSDSALYYCGYTSISITKFDNGTFLLLKRGSVTLNCTMLTGTVNGDHNVYWFRKNSEGSGLGTLFTTTRSGGPCARSSEDGPDVLRCVYSLPRRNVTVSDAGTYHCAVASCGRILFGPGTRLYVGGQFEVSVFVCILVLCFHLIFIHHVQRRDADDLHYASLNLKERR